MTTQMKMAMGDKVTAAFKVLRKQGYLARQNFTRPKAGEPRTFSLAVAAMPAAKQERVRGYVFYRGTDGDDSICIHYGQVRLPGGVMIGEETLEVGKRVAAEMVAAGLTVTWDGSAGLAIKVTDEA